VQSVVELGAIEDHRHEEPSLLLTAILTFAVGAAMDGALKQVGSVLPPVRPRHR
jgi:hypothetical protein